MVLSPDGLLLTNNHVVESAARGGVVTAVFQDGSTAPAEIVGRDPGFDLAVLRVRNVVRADPDPAGQLRQRSGSASRWSRSAPRSGSAEP